MIKINRIGYNFINAGGIDVNRPNGSGDYLFLYFRSDTEIWKDEKYELVPKNTFYLFKKGEPQIYRKTDGHFINDWIHFDIDPYDNFFEKLNIPFNTPIKLTNDIEISNGISLLVSDYFDVGPHKEEILSMRATSLFYKFSDLHLFSEKNGSRSMQYQKELMDIRKKIFSYEYRPICADDISKEMGVSTSYLQHMYKDFFHVTIQKDIIWGRTEYAANLLASTDYPIAKIAEMAGYDSIEHFSRQFKQIKCCSPSNYRKGFI